MPLSTPQNEDQYGYVVWLTGLSGAGKTTLAHALQLRLSSLGSQTVVLDGDSIRRGLCSDLTFSRQDRNENVRRTAEMAALLVENGMVCIVALISPYQDQRTRARRRFKPGHFVEVFVNASIEVCQQRDSKGLYTSARSGQIAEFTGVSSPYEPPLAPEIEIRTDLLSVSDCVCIICDSLQKRMQNA